MACKIASKFLSLTVKVYLCGILKEGKYYASYHLYDCQYQFLD